MYPSNGRLKRRPLLSAGTIGPVPPPRRYYGALRLPAVRLAALRCLRLAIPPFASGLLPAAGTHDRGLRGVGVPVPEPEISMEAAASLRFPGDPHVPAPCSWTPVGPKHVRPLRRVGAAPACVNDGGSRKETVFGARSHGIGTGCLRFAVRVSPPHARLASGCWPSSTGRDSFTRRVTTKGFRVRVSSSFPELA